MTASVRSETRAKTGLSQAFWIFSMPRVSNQVPDPSRTGHLCQEYRLYGDFVRKMLGDHRCMSLDGVIRRASGWHLITTAVVGACYIGEA
jgi:hypothetical protein